MAGIQGLDQLAVNDTEMPLLQSLQGAAGEPEELGGSHRTWGCPPQVWEAVPDSRDEQQRSGWEGGSALRREVCGKG